MLKWAIISAIIAVIAGALGLGVIAGAAAGIAKILFFIFLALFVLLLVSAIFVGKKVKSAFRISQTTSSAAKSKRVSRVSGSQQLAPMHVGAFVLAQIAGPPDQPPSI